MEKSLTVVLREANPSNSSLALDKSLNVGMKALQNLAEEQKQLLLAHQRWRTVRGVQAVWSLQMQFSSSTCNLSILIELDDGES